MPKLSNRPCAQCATDTLHEGIVCKTCGAIFQMPDRERLRSATIKQAMHTKYRPAVRAQVKANAAERRAANIRPFQIAPTRAVFGSGRERKRV